MLRVQAPEPSMDTPRLQRLSVTMGAVRELLVQEMRASGAGLELVAHTPHQFYISRYPMGREATVSWGGPELIFTNNWPATCFRIVRSTSSWPRASTAAT